MTKMVAQAIMASLDQEERVSVSDCIATQSVFSWISLKRSVESNVLVCAIGQSHEGR
jgi:hypothetical protein